MILSLECCSQWLNSTVPVIVAVYISNDGKTRSVSNPLAFVPYDSRCMTCSIAQGTATCDIKVRWIRSAFCHVVVRFSRLRPHASTFMFDNGDVVAHFRRTCRAVRLTVGAICPVKPVQMTNAWCVSLPKINTAGPKVSWRSDLCEQCELSESEAEQREADFTTVKSKINSFRHGLLVWQGAAPA